MNNTATTPQTVKPQLEGNDAPAKLVLEDGTAFNGRAFGAAGHAIGEVVFNTGMTGYEEVITDPSYRGQIVAFTYPELGNTGINEYDHESGQAMPQAVIARNICHAPSNWRCRGGYTLSQYLRDRNIPGIYNLDTRTLTRHLRSRLPRYLLSIIELSKTIVELGTLTLPPSLCRPSPCFSERVSWLIEDRA